MQLIVELKCGALELPINYNHILQGALYRALSDNRSLSSEIHDFGVQNRSRTFKQFTFSSLEGKYLVKGKKIVFFDRVKWEIRSTDARVIGLLHNRLLTRGITLNRNKLTVLRMETINRRVETGEIEIIAKTPICEYSTNKETKGTYYYTPEQLGFYELVKENALKKYEAFYSQQYEGPLEFLPALIRKKDKVVTTYKGHIIEGWKGEYRLIASPEMLNLLYNTGLGSKNAQGFGMFDILEEE